MSLDVYVVVDDDGDYDYDDDDLLLGLLLTLFKTIVLF